MIVTSLIAIALLGLIIGSFLNVVIYRLPRDMSISQPRWSFCPHCRTTIRWHDNIPVLGWLALRGRCRSCTAPISMQYPLVELITGLVFVACFDAIVVGRLVPNATNAVSAGIMVLAFGALFASMLSNSVIDLEHYMIDVSLTWFAMAVGLVAQGAAAVATAAPVHPQWRMGVAAAASGLTWYIVSRWTAHSNGESAAIPEAPQTPLRWSVSATAIIILSILLSALVTLIATARHSPADPNAFAARAIGVLAILLFVLVLCAIQERPADAEMITMLEVERPQARRIAMRELAWLMPSIVVGVGVWVAWPLIAGDAMATARTWDWRLLSGLSDGMIGLIGGAALGWSVRIFFTLVFGKEAYGTGDIFLMAGIGAVGGFWICLIAFFAACFLALVGVLAAMFRKNCRAIPFGPWLALGTLVAVWIRPHVQSVVEPAAIMVWNGIRARLGYAPI